MTRGARGRRGPDTGGRARRPAASAPGLARRRRAPSAARAAALALLLAARAAGAAEPEPISPDRASITANASTVAAGAVQLEAGVEFSRARSAGEAATERAAIQVLARLGLSDRVEVRLGGEPLVRLRGPEEDTGFGDLLLGLKARVLDQHADGWWPALGVQPFVKLPTARAPRGSERPDFGAVAIASQPLPLGFSVDVNAGAVAVGQEQSDDYAVQALVGAGVNRELLVPALAGFAELAFATRAERAAHGGRDTLLFGAGLVYLVAPWLAVDASVTTSVFGRGPDYAVRAGMSARFPR